MTVQVLVATIDQQDHSLLERMNIQTDAIVGNQCDRNEVETFAYHDHVIKWLSFCERGVGLNRNNALMRADADIVMFADDDMRLVDSYETIVQQAFRKIPQADVIVFDLLYADKPRPPIRKIQRLSARSCMRFGTARISARLSSLRINGISFNLCFGGGARFSSGEDSIFLRDCLRHNLKIYSYPVFVASLNGRESTWFKGYTDTYFFDKGVTFSVLFPRMGRWFAFAHCLKKRRRYARYGWFRAYRQMKSGIRFRKTQL